MTDMIAQRATSAEVKASVPVAFNSWMQSVEGSKGDGRSHTSEADEMDRLLTAALSAGQQGRSSARGTAAGGASSRRDVDQEYDWLYGVNRDTGVAVGLRQGSAPEWSREGRRRDSREDQVQDDVPEIVL